MTRYFGKCPPCVGGKRRAVKTSRAKLTDKKINTLVEKRMVQIAKKQIAKERVNLILREFWHATGMKREFNLMPLGRKIYYKGWANKIATIDKIDVNQPVNAPANDADPDLFVEAGAVVDGDGALQGMITESIMGRRQTDKIKISGFTLGVKAFFAAVQALPQDFQLVDGPALSAGEIAPAQPPDNVLRQMETVVLKYAIVGVLRAESSDPAAPDPLAPELLKYSTWGYSSQLDSDERSDTLWTKKRTFIEGEIKCNVNQIRHKDFTAEKYHKLNEPLSVSYAPADQNGQQTSDWSFFLVLRSNVPDYAAGSQTYVYADYAPNVTCYTKTHYHE